MFDEHDDECMCDECMIRDSLNGEIEALSSRLRAATQEIERLTRERDEARAEWQGADGKADWYAAECERLTRDLAASVSLVNIYDECRNSAERECDRLRMQVREACGIAEWALSVVCGDIPMFRNGETLAKRAAIAAIRHAAGVDNA